MAKTSKETKVESEVKQEEAKAKVETIPKVEKTKSKAVPKSSTKKSSETTSKSSEKKESGTTTKTAVKQTKTKPATTTKQTASKKETTKSTPKKTATKTATKKGATAKQKESYIPKEEVVKHLQIYGFNNLPLAVNLYDDVENPVAVVLVIHGMQEHSGRYDAFAKHLNKNGFIVVTSDLRGHGLTAENAQKRGFGEKDIFTETIADQLNILAWISENSNLPIYVFGHSYGSMLTQVLVQQTPLIEKAVICGTANGGSALMRAGGMVASMLSPFKSKESSGGLIEKLCIKSYGKKFEKGNWLTRDEKVFEAYLSDPLCGGSFPFSFYKSMIKNMNKANDNMSKIGKKKLFLIAGDHDPVGANGKQVEKLFKLYLKNNVDAKLKIYENCRHELLNETNKEEVYADVIDFFKN